MTPLALALLEGVAVFASVSVIVLVWLQPMMLNLVDVLGQASVLSGGCIVAFYYTDLYDLRIVRSFGAFAVRLIQSLGLAFIVLAGFYMLFPETRMADGPFFSSILIIVALLVPLRAVSYAIMRTRSFTDRVLIVGASPLSYKLIEEINSHPHSGYTIIGVIDDGRVSERLLYGYPSLGPLEDIGRIIDEMQPDRIIVALSERRGRLPVHELLKAQADGVAVEDAVHLYERLTGKVAIEAIVPSALIFSADFKKSRLELMLGRAISVAVSLFGLVGLAPVLAIVAIAIKIDSAGPVLFVQSRVGAYGRPFKLYKFRTMRVAEAKSEWARDNEDRITRVGKWLRKFRLDELPQFLNILRGDMNLVGPRPHPVSNFKLFTERIPYYTLRSAVRPGVTGWAQIRYGYANDLEEEIEKMRYDLFYIKHLSLWLDLRILIDSVKTVMCGRGSRAAGAYTQDAA